MKQIHQQAIESGNVAYHEFLLIYKRDAKVVFGFVEGKDDPCFYRGFIESMLPPDWKLRLIKAGNKNRVLSALSCFDWGRFNNKQICFFVDRDLSEFTELSLPAASNLYTTDHYSLENLLGNFEIFERVIDEAFSIDKMSPQENETIKNLFNANLEVFSEAMALVMAQILVWRKQKLKVCLDNIKPSEFFEFEYGQIKLKSNYREVTNRLQYAANMVGVPLADQTFISEAESLLKSSGGIRKFVRGKYILWFFVQSAIKTHESISRYCSAYPSAPKARISLGFGNAFVVLGPRIRPPETLVDFVKTNYLEFLSRSSTQN